MVKEYAMTVLAAMLAAGGYGWFVTKELEKREYITRRTRLIIWGCGLILLTGISFWLRAYEYSFWKTERYLILLYAMIGLAWTDQKERKIPNKMLGILIFIRQGILAGEIVCNTVLWKEFLIHAVGGALGSLALMLAAYFIARKALGMGDVKLFAVTGFYLGFSLNYIVLFFSLVFAAAYGLWNMLRKKMKAKDEIAFGPFVAAGLWFSLIVGF